MSTFTIAHDIPGRMRIRYGKDVFSPVQGEILKRDLSNWSMIQSVEVNSITGSVLMTYDQTQKGSLLDQLQTLDIRYLKNADTSGIVIHSQTPEVKAMNHEYKMRFMKIVGKRYFIKWFLPAGIGNAITVFKSCQFIWEGLKSLAQLKVNVPVLDATSISVSMLQGNFNVAGNIMMLLNISDLLEDYTRKKTKLELSQSLSIKFDKVWVFEDGIEREIPMSELKKGDIVISQMGSMIPIDGEIESGEAMVNEASFTGEPLSRRVVKEDTVFAGTLVEEGKLFIRVRNLQDESRISNIVKMIDTNESLKASIQAKAEHLADSIVPFSFIGFFGVLAFTRNLTRATSVLMVDYSCAIRLSTSISVISAMLEASNRNVLVKGGKYLEAVKDADVIVFDKTGTLTNANPQVKKVIPFGGYSRDEVLRIAACLEEHFPHSVANAIVNQAKKEGLVHEEEHAKVEYIIAHGIATSLHGKHTVIGSDHFIFEDEGIEKTDELKRTINSLESEGAGSMIYLAIDNKIAGIISIFDPLKTEAKQVIQDLKSLGIQKVVMLTGDCENAAGAVAHELGLDEYRSSILPEGKAAYIQSLKDEGHTVIMVGDGINDTPALSTADVSVSMQDSSDLARELADVTLVSSNLNELITLRQLSTNLFDRIHANYRFIVAFNSSLIALGALGLITPSTSSLLHNGSTFAIAATCTRNYL